MSQMTAPPERPPLADNAEPERWIKAWRSPRKLVARLRDDSLLRNGLFIMLTTVVTSLFGYGFWLVAARIFPPSIVGLSAALISASQLVSLLASQGVTLTLVQSLAEQPSVEDWSLTLWTGMVAATLVSLVGSCAVLLILLTVSREYAVLHRPAYAIAFVVLTMAVTVGTIFDYTFVAERVAGNMLGRNAVLAGSKLPAVVLATLVLGREHLVILGSWAVAAVMGMFVGTGLLVRRVGWVRRPPLFAMANRARRLRSRLVGNQLIGIGGQMPGFLLPLLVTARLSASNNAYFYTTWTMCGIFLIIAPAVSTSLLAEGVRVPSAMREKVRATLGVIAALLVPCMILFLLAGGPILATFGAVYEQHGVPLMHLVVLAAVPNAILCVYTTVLRVEQRLTVAAWLSLGTGFGTVIVAWLLLPVLGINAAGWAWLAMQVGGCLFVAVDRIRRRLSPLSVPQGSLSSRTG